MRHSWTRHFYANFLATMYSIGLVCISVVSTMIYNYCYHCCAVGVASQFRRVKEITAQYYLFNVSILHLNGDEMNVQ